MLDGETIDRILALTLAQGLSETTIRELRANWPDLHFSHCLDDDICGVDPVRSVPGINLYLVDGRAHCLTLTGDLEGATGLVLAEVEDDDV